MKCLNCNCEVPSDYTHSFDSNICPKCGKAIMKEKVKILWSELHSVMNENDNDLGSLAVWILNKYEPENIEEATLPQEQVEIDIPIEKEPRVSKAINKAPQPIKKAINNLPHSNDGKSLLDIDRINIFKKRAGVDKIKSLVKEIQSAEIDSEDTDNENIDDANDQDMPYSDEPLNYEEIERMNDLFTVPNPNTPIDINEMKKLQRIEEMQSSGSVGIIRRSS